MPKDTFPEHYRPMLATIGKQPFNNKDWLHEVKWDGYRLMAYVEKNNIQLRTRKNNVYTNRFQVLAHELKKWKHTAVLDGEVVVIDEHGISHFNSLENWYSPNDGILKYYVFDILYLDGKSLLTLPLIERKSLLKKNFPKSEIICHNDYFDGMQGIDLYEKANQFKLEGIISKKKDSEYFPGARTNEWLKIKITQLAEVFIVGFTKRTPESTSFRNLIVAIKDGKQLRYIGLIGTGFTERVYKELTGKLKVVIKCPLQKEIDPNRATRFRKATADIVVWVKPDMKCFVQYSEITNDGVLRHPSYKGLVQ